METLLQQTAEPVQQGNVVDPVLLLVVILAMAAVVGQLYRVILGIKRRALLKLEKQLDHCQEQHAIVTHNINELHKQIKLIEGKNVGAKELAKELLALVDSLREKCPACHLEEQTNES